MLASLFERHATPASGGAQGRPRRIRPRVPADLRLYAVGDIHGRADLLDRIHAAIWDDCRSWRGRKRLVYLGDYVDRGRESFSVVERLTAGPLPGFEAVYLKGNHEDFLLAFLEDPGWGYHWMRNGGLATLESYGVATGGMPGDDEIAVMRELLIGALPDHHLAFFRSLVLSHVEGDYLFVHAGIRPGVPLPEQRERDLLWIRDEFLRSEIDFGKCVVHGHSITSVPDERPNRIGIDTGAFVSGRLTCLVLEGETRRFIQT